MKQSKKVKNNTAFYTKLLNIILITIAVIVGYRLGERRWVSNLNSMVFVDYVGKAKIVGKPDFVSGVTISSSAYVSTKDSLFKLTSQGHTEPKFVLCNVQYDTNLESPTDDCTWVRHNINGSVVSVIYKKYETGNKAATILAQLKDMSSYGIQIDKLSGSTPKPDYFTDEEVKVWLEEIKKW